ncbi:DUF3488 and DUF4129 domain-containing transglutaminase family protein [Microbacterium sp. NPDC055910]|uniref:transglutaminase TgpA family protein n=1 Tax=Microbacterium sp. NPDC055910 TaxID=3345659 RepID=UPI0035E11AAA
MSAEARPVGRGDLLTTVALLTALTAALVPVLPMVQGSWWLAASVGVAVIVLGAGHVARRRGLPAVAVSLIEAVVWVLCLTGLFLRDTAFLWVIPTPDTIGVVPSLVAQAFEEIAVGAAPLPATPALSFLIVGALGLLTVLVDHVVLTARMPLLASIGIIAVSLIPAIAVPGRIDVTAFVLLGAAVLFLLRAETRSREAPAERVVERRAGVPATAFSIAAVALVVAVVAAPLLPTPAVQTGGGLGGGPGIDASLQLGDDLRRPQEIEVLRMRSTESTAPYLRATTLSRFDGDVWLPDRVRTVPLDSAFGLGALGVGEDIRMVETTANVEVVNLASVWAPITFPAVEVNGLEGEWAAVPYNRTVVAQTGSTQGQRYEVVASVPRPTLEQIRARSTGSGEAFEDAQALPGDVPPVVAELAAEITAGATNDYDALIALQRWFRGPDFRYSLDAPVEDGFDGTGVEAVERFLEVRRGYCIHFSSAFALMARTLDMPSRIVVGYLPGAATDDVEDDETVYSVSSSLLHAWPEVYFDGIGWIGFEPTSGLGSPTAFLSSASSPTGVDADDEAEPRPSASASASTTPAPDSRLDPRDEALPGAGTGAAGTVPTVVVVFGVLLLLAMPALAREVRRRRLVAASRAGDTAAAWAMMQDAAIDVGAPVPASESPRAFAARLVAEYGAPADAIEVLVRAIERASYAPARVAGYWHGDEVTEAAAAVRAALLAAAPPSRRLLAAVAPRSLVVRPGSVYASGVARAG